jgi:hypothetical protein
MEYHFYDFVGNLGVVLILGSYLMVQMRKLSATGLAYTVSNGLGALFVLYSLLYDFNLSAFIIETVWLIISLFGMARYYQERKI